MPEIQHGPVGEIVAANIRNLRAVRGMSLRALSARLSELGRPMLQSGLGRIEMGSRRVDVDDLVVLAAALEVRPEQLLEPFECEVCHNAPPPGFACRTCGAEGE